MKGKFFVEVGTCDFDTCLPLLENGWKGIMIEPVLEYCLSLREKIPEELRDNVKILNYAVSDGKYSAVKIAVSDQHSSQEWVRGISHITSDNHLGTKLSENAKNVTLYAEGERVVAALTLDEVFERENVDHVDFLKIDVEGHETNIINSYSWKIKPTFLKIEHKHVDDIHMKKILVKNGYMVYTERDDIYAIH